LCRRHLVFPLIALDIPLLKIVRLGKSFGVIAHFVCTGKRVLLAASDVVSLPARSDFAIAIDDAYHARRSIGVDIDAILARAQNREGQIRCIDFVAFIVFKMQHA
jgi:hypothetical protein